MEILVVEDEATISDFLVRGLESEGHRVRSAADGIEGEKIALGRTVRADPDGLIQVIRNLLATPGAAVVLFSPSRD